jgi:hypothetical protein
MDPLIRMEHQTTNLGVGGSNPSGRANEIKGLGGFRHDRPNFPDNWQITGFQIGAGEEPGQGRASDDESRGGGSPCRRRGMNDHIDGHARCLLLRLCDAPDHDLPVIAIHGIGGMLTPRLKATRSDGVADQVPASSRRAMGPGAPLSEAKSRSEFNDRKLSRKRVPGQLSRISVQHLLGSAPASATSTIVETPAVGTIVPLAPPHA